MNLDEPRKIAFRILDADDPDDLRILAGQAHDAIIDLAAEIDRLDTLVRHLNKHGDFPPPVDVDPDPVETLRTMIGRVFARFNSLGARDDREQLFLADAQGALAQARRNLDEYARIRGL